jgi:hypothetical protein
MIERMQPNKWVWAAIVRLRKDATPFSGWLKIDGSVANSIWRGSMRARVLVQFGSQYGPNGNQIHAKCRMAHRPISLVYLRTAMTTVRRALLGIFTELSLLGMPATSKAFFTSASAVFNQS